MRVFRRPNAVAPEAAKHPAAGPEATLGTAGRIMREGTGPVVVAVDGGARSRGAVEWAAAEASARQCALRIVYPVRMPLMTDAPAGLMPAYPWEDAPGPETGARILSEAADGARRVDPALEVTTHVQVGGTSRVLREERRAALIVVSRSRSAGRQWLAAGSAGGQAARRAGCPVVIVALSSQPVRGPSAGQIVAAAEDSDDPADVLSFAFRAALRRGVGVTLLRTVVPGSSGAPGLRGREMAARSRCTVEDALRLCLDAFPEVEVRQQLAGCPAGCDFVAESPGAALIVHGSATRADPPLSIQPGGTGRLAVGEQPGRYCQVTWPSQRQFGSLPCRWLPGRLAGGTEASRGSPTVLGASQQRRARPCAARPPRRGDELTPQ